MIATISPKNTLLTEDLHVLNIGLKGFSAPILQHNGNVLDLEWIPTFIDITVKNNANLSWTLATLIGDTTIDAANKIAFERYLAAQPVLVGIGLAKDTLPNMQGDLANGKIILHAGPPILWKDMCGPQQGAIIGAILYEGWANTHEDAQKLVENGEITLDPCHHHAAVGPMAGIISPNMPVWIVKNTTAGNISYSNMNEGLGKVLRFGANSSDVITRLNWMRDVLAPTLTKVLATLGTLDLKPIMAQALHMGDEVHNRNMAASSLLFKKITSAALRTDNIDHKDLADVLEFIANNDHFFLNLSMAACKSMLDAAAGVENSSMVTAMARNGVQFGIQISAFPERWFVAPAPFVEGLFFSGYSQDDAARDLGDSAITETAGVGGFSMAAAPAIVQFIGGTPQDAIANTLKMFHITLGKNNAFTLPALAFGGAPAGIDVRKVVDTSIAPIINTGIAHKQAGIGQVGAGITFAPLACFTLALAALGEINGDK